MTESRAQSGETRPRLIFESSDGLLVLYGQTTLTAIELLHDNFIAERMYFGEPPFRLAVENVPAANPFVTADDIAA